MTGRQLLESVQAREARWQLAEAEEAYRRHMKFCATCRPRGRAPRYCPDGREASEIRADLRAQLEHERAEDRKPMPGEQPLW